MKKYILILLVLFPFIKTVLSQDMDSANDIKITQTSGDIPDKTSIDEIINPFSPQTRLGLKLNISTDSYVNIKILDSNMSLVRTLISEKMEQGKYKLYWESRPLSPGKYYYSLEIAGTNELIQFYRI